MGQYKIELSPEEEKALLTDMISIQDWIENAIHNKARRCIDEIVFKFAKAELELETLFTPSEEREIEKAKKGKIIVEPRHLPEKIKKLIVRRTKVESAQERNRRFKGY